MWRGAMIGGERWRVRIVPPLSPSLVDRTGHRTVATTDTGAHVVNVSNALYGEKLRTVLAHELTHVAMNVYGLEEWIKRNVPRESRIRLEETIANLVADRGCEILNQVHSIIGDTAP